MSSISFEWVRTEAGANAFTIAIVKPLCTTHLQHIAWLAVVIHSASQMLHHSQRSLRAGRVHQAADAASHTSTAEVTACKVGWSDRMQAATQVHGCHARSRDHCIHKLLQAAYHGDDAGNGNEHAEGHDDAGRLSKLPEDVLVRRQLSTKGSHEADHCKAAIDELLQQHVCQT